MPYIARENMEKSIKLDQYVKPYIFDNVYDRIFDANNNDFKQDEAFYILDIQDLIDKHNIWLKKFPRVRPFYAMKVNSSQIFQEVLAGLGAGFDCASRSEISQVIPLGINPSEDIIYANPCKGLSHLKYATSAGVDLMTFDNEFELKKIAKCCPQARLVMRLAVDDSNSIYPFGSKFGATTKTIRKLFQLAQDLKLNIVGASFHVGCRVTDARAYSKAILRCKDVFTIGEKEFKLKMTHLDIGGGFPGTSWHSGIGKENMLDLIAQEVNLAIDKYFPVQDYPNLKIISEPGTYYCASSMFLATQVIARRIDDNAEQEADSEDKENFDRLKIEQRKINHLFINEGMYGTFLAVLCNYPFAPPIVLLKDGERDTREIVSTTIWGQTCDGTDKIFTEIPLPELDIGEWILFRELGDYTLTLNTPFNGFPSASVVYHAQEETLDQLKKLKTWPLIQKRLHGRLENKDEYMQVRKLGPN